MRSHPVLAAALVTLAAARAHAQEDDFGAYLSLTFTPVGAFAPLAPVTPAAAGHGYMVRYGRLSLGDGEAMQSVGLRVEGGGDRSRTGWTIGAQQCDGCEAMLMVGVDVVRPLRPTATGAPRAPRFQAALAPSLGVAVSPAELGSFIVLSAALALPLSVEIPVGARARLVPFAQPGLGIGVVAGGGGGAFGLRPLVGGGVELTGLAGGMGVSVGAQKVMVDGGTTRLGAALTWRPAGGPR